MIGIGRGKGDGGFAIVEIDNEQRPHCAAIGAKQRPGDEHCITEGADMGEMGGAGGSAQFARIGLVDAVDGKIWHRYPDVVVALFSVTGGAGKEREIGGW